MRTTQLIAMTVAFTILCSGLPLFDPEDRNRDQTVDLYDAVMGAKDVAQSAEKTLMFRQSVENAITTFYIVSGLKTVIKSDRESKSKSLSFLDVPYVISSIQFAIPTDDFPYLYQKLTQFKSYIIIPESPPPKSIDA